MSSKRGKRPGLRTRSKNGRAVKKAKAREPNRVLAVMHVRQPMCFYSVEEGTPEEGELVLVQLKNGVFRYGMVLAGQFAAHDYHTDQFVTFGHPEWITHWMEIVPPSPSIQEAAMQAGAMPAEVEDSMTKAHTEQEGGAPDRAEDVYA